MSYIGLMDCNNFFVSCERLFRPDLVGRPVAVLSSNDGCIVARSNEVKVLGIPMGAPYFQVEDICTEKDVVLFSSNFALYRDISQRVMRVLSALCTEYEVYSIDEAFFSVADPQEAQVLGDAMRMRVLRDVGIPVSVGVAATKTIAKHANTLAKRNDGVVVLTEAAWQKEAETLSCGSIWGVGGQTAATLRAYEIRTVADVLGRGVGYMRTILGVMGERLYFELSGTAVDHLGGTRENVEERSIMSSRSFAHATSDKALLQSAVGYHTIRLAEKLRRRSHVTRRVSIRVSPGRNHRVHGAVYAAQRVLDTATADTITLLKASLALLDTFYDPAVSYKKAGVTFGGVGEDVHTSSLFDATPAAVSTLDVITDTLNHTFGKDTVRPGIVRTGGIPAHADHRSPEYTTQWNDVKTIKAV